MHRATDEELLQEVIDELKDALESDLDHAPEQSQQEDFEIKYSRFMAKVKSKANHFKQNAHGYRQICCLPAFALGLVMASRIPSHYTHSQWFKLGALGDMINVHGTVSCPLHNPTPPSDLIPIHTVHLRVYRPKPRIPRTHRQPRRPSPRFTCHPTFEGPVRRTGSRPRRLSIPIPSHGGRLSEPRRPYLLVSRTSRHDRQMLP